MGDVDNDTHASAPEPAGLEAVAARPSQPASRSSEPFWDRIKRHKVVEWALAYVAFGYALLHGVQMLRETFEWPLLVSRLTVIGLVLGAPIAVTLAFYHGHRAQHRVSRQELSILIALLVVAGSVLWWVSRNSHERVATATPAEATSGTGGPANPSASFNPPPHSIAVLPFVNMSGDKEQEYFSEGLTEELLNSLSRINKLQVAARTSSFSFQGQHPDIATVAHKLNVGAVLEGSVRRSNRTVRITAQLNDAVTGFHLWSQTYDRAAGDVLKLQTEIATAVAGALKVTLLGDEAAKIELGGSRNPAAFDAYLRAAKIYYSSDTAKEVEAAIAGYTEAIRVDSDYALAYAARSLALVNLASDQDTPRPVRRVGLDKAQADARKAIALAPGLAEGHVALAALYENTLEFTRASEEYERALALAPGSARVLRNCGRFAVAMGRTDLGITSLRRAVVLDPLSVAVHSYLGDGLFYLRHYEEGMAAYKDAKALVPDGRSFMGNLGLTYYLLGDLQAARSFCEANTEKDETAQFCLAITYDKLGNHADAEAMLARIRTRIGDSGALDYTDIYGQWGDPAKALEWLETAMKLRDPGLEWLRLDPLADPLRNEPRFQAIERALKFPD